MNINTQQPHVLDPNDLADVIAASFDAVAKKIKATMPPSVGREAAISVLYKSMVDVARAAFQTPDE